MKHDGAGMSLLRFCLPKKRRINVFKTKKGLINGKYFRPS